jgi:inorganic phosphate transporter, PiT family
MGALIVAIVAAVGFDITNGFHDSANAIAALVATGAAKPAPAVAWVSVFHLAGPLLVGTAVAATIADVIDVSAQQTTVVVGAALTAALIWNLVTWSRGLPSSSSHALVGGLVGAALVDAGVHAVNWGGFDGLRPAGVVGVLVALAISPLIGFGVGFVLQRTERRALRRARRELEQPIRHSEWATAGALAFSHGTNDAQKTMGVITLLLVAHGELSHFAVPLWVKLVAALSLTLGTSLGGWRIVRTLGMRIYRLHAIDGFVSQASSAGVILGAAALGAPVSTTHVVASSVVGVGAQQRWRHVRWRVVREMGLAWVVTLPVCALVAAAAVPAWKAFA